MRTIFGLLFLVGCSVDVDNDGFSAEQGDCNDDNPNINPDATELCDGIDNNCNDNIDENVTQTFYIDADSDGFGSLAALEDSEDIVQSCLAPEGYVDNQLDCNDTLVSISPSASEVCDINDVDENCNGLSDDNDEGAIGKTDWFIDSDGDSFADFSVVIEACDQTAGYISVEPGAGFDCDDTSADIRPETATEISEGVNLEVIGDDEDIDENCDGFIACYFDGDDDGYGAGTPILQPLGTNCDGASELVGNLSRTADDCDDDNAYTYPAAAYSEPGEDCMQDNDLDGFGDESPPLGVTAGQDCNDLAANISPSSLEIPADGVDQDCNGGDICYFDADSDSFGNSLGNPILSTDLFCDGENEAYNLFDCDDTDENTYPGAAIYEAEIEPATGYPSCKKDSDGDGYGDLNPGVTVNAGTDCDDADINQFPNADEYCNNEDDDCDNIIDEAGAVDEIDYFSDADGDMYVDSSIVSHECYAPNNFISEADAIGMSDCDDNDPDINPAADEIEADGLDSNCDGYEACYVDADSDSFGSDLLTFVVDIAGTTDCITDQTSQTNNDCDDYDYFTHPGSAETDSLSQCMTDSDNDGYGDDYGGLLLSLPDDLFVGTDCNDSNTDIKPGETEITADEIDQNCDGIEVCWLDGDNDSQGNALGNTITVSYEENFSCDGVRSSSNQDDCDDNNEDIFVGSDEYCNGADDDCDGLTDEGINNNAPLDAPTWYADADLDGYGGMTGELELVQCEQPIQYTSIDDAIDCNDLNADANPFAEETCFDGIDNDCNDFIDGMSDCEKNAGSDAFVQVLGSDADARAGYDLGTGDVDGDGFDDLVVSSPGEGNGRVYVLYGPLRDIYLSLEYDASFEGTSSDVLDDLGLGTQVELVDLNGDNQKDIVLASPGSNELGMVYVIYSPENDRYDGDYSISSIVDATISGNEIDTQIGCRLSSAGDVNDDRLEDLLISTCTERDDTSGFATLLYGQETNLMSGEYTLDNADGIEAGVSAITVENSGIFSGSGSIDSTGIQDNFGAYASGVGDLNGDGFDEMMFGAVGALSTDQGSAYLLYGDSNFYNSDYVSTVDMDASGVGVNANDKFGMSFEGGGDINGDGYNEFLVSAPEASTARGYVDIYTGETVNSGVFGALTPIATISGETNNDYFGTDILGINDINSDGYDDVLISAKRNGNIGATYLFFGPLEGTIDLSAGDEAAGKITGQTVSAGLNTDFGSVMALSDLNGDSELDIVVSSGLHDTTDTTNIGAVFVFVSLLE
jgi:hypothetical protein